MGWSSGSGIMEDIIKGLKKNKITNRYEIYKVLIPAFESGDCDTLYELCDCDPQFREAFDEINPPEE